MVDVIKKVYKKSKSLNAIYQGYHHYPCKH